MKKKGILNYLPYCLVLSTILFNLYLYLPELSIKSDPNDNIFQFGLINQLNEVWEEKIADCKKNNFAFCFLNFAFLFDHWVPQWAQGFPLPFYYSHLPQIVIVASYRLINAIASLFNCSTVQLFNWFNLTKYLFLCFLPLPFFIAGRNFGLSSLASSLAALFASQISTDGLYGIDPPSYLWRGYGLSSQLFAVFFLPLAVSWVFRGLKEGQEGKEGKEGIWKPVLFLWLTAESHLGLGLIAFLSGFVFILMDFNLKNIFKRLFELIKIYAVTIFFLSYYIISFLYYNRYHNISFWDPIWKFDSFGAQEVSKMFLNGELFDFGRRPILTMLVTIGFFKALISGSSYHRRRDFALFVLAFLFPFWLTLFFGSQTWGPLLSLLPGLKGFHQHRFIVGVQLAGIFLAAFGATRLMRLIGHIGILLFAFLAFLIFPLFPQTIRYAQHNTQLIKNANQRFDQDWPDFEKLLERLNSLPPGRVYAGRPGNWGNKFKLGDTQIYMALSVRGYPILSFLPETWSPNSDTEQFFDETKFAHYGLYNIRYVVAPKEITFPDFVEPVQNFGKYHLYQIPTSGYFILGSQNISVSSQKGNFSNLVHLWQISSLVEKKSFPFLFLSDLSDPGSESFLRSQIVNHSNSITMIDEVTYKIHNSKAREKQENIFSRNPFSSQSRSPSGTINQEKVTSQKYEAQIKVNSDCQNCVLIFKMTYHPNWQFILDGKKVSAQIFFPFFQGIKIQPGNHKVEALYEPNRLRISLFLLEIMTLFTFIIIETISHFYSNT